MDLKEELMEYNPYNEQEKKDKEIMLKALDSFGDIFERSNEIAHFTASNWIVNKERTKVLMAYHNIYNSWAWTGGHADGDTNLMNVAIKEAREETGINDFRVISNGIYSIEILPVDGHIKRGKYVATHLHFDVCYLLEADENDTLKIKEDENSGVKWININEVLNFISEANMLPVYSKLNEKLKDIKR